MTTKIYRRRFFQALIPSPFIFLLLALFWFSGCDNSSGFNTYYPCQTCTLTVTVSPPDSIRMGETLGLWESPESISFQSNFFFSGDPQGSSGSSGGHTEMEEGEHKEEHNSEYVEIGFEHVGDYNVAAGFMPVQGLEVYHEEEEAWDPHIPEFGETHYLVIQVGSSAGTGNHPHMHVEFDPEATEEEEEVAEEDFFALGRVHTYGDVRVTIDGTPYAGALVVNDAELLEVETSKGMRYGNNFAVPDGTYDITVVLDPAYVGRLGDTEEIWKTPITYTYTAAIIGNDGIINPYGYLGRTLDLDDTHDFLVLEDWEGLGTAVGHPEPDLHNGYLENTLGDFSQEIHDDENSLLSEIGVAAASNLYNPSGTLISPLPGEDLFFSVTLFDPKATLHHDEENFFDMPNSKVEITLTSSNGNSVTLHEDDLHFMYSHELGFHYGANINILALGGIGAGIPSEGASGGGSSGESEGGGGHDH